jgi:chromosome segregation ATPase
MGKKTVKELIHEPAMLNKALTGVSFNNEDRQFLERQYNGIIEYLKDKLTENQRFLAEILIDNNASMSNKMDMISEGILEIKRDIKELRGEFKELKIEVKEVRAEVKELKIEIKTINMELLVIHKQLLVHENRIKILERRLNASTEEDNSKDSDQLKK